MIRNFDEIISLAVARKGGFQALQDALATTPALAPSAVALAPDDRLLAEMTRRVFNAGFSSKVVEAKWPAFETTFKNFDVHACAFMTEDDVDAAMRNPAIVRNGSKIRAVQVNARLLLHCASRHGSAAQYFAHWPDHDYVGLLRLLKEQGSYLGGDAGMRFLRSIGKPAFITTKDVVAALLREGVITRAPKTARDYETIQDAFNHWSQQSGRNLTEISRILAMSLFSQDQEPPPT